MPRCSVPSRAVMTAADSDIDILVDLDPAIVVTIFDYAGVKDFIADIFDRPVDVVSREV
jgi:predicted nucleotidyltransferase